MPDARLNHYILIKYRKDTPREHTQMFCQKMLALGQAIPSINDLLIAQDILHDDRSWDVLISMQFQSIDELREYQDHPSHRAVIAFNQPYVEDVASIDFFIPENL